MADTITPIASVGVTGTMDGQVNEPSSKKAKMNESDVSNEITEQPSRNGDKAERPVVLDEDGNPLSKRAVKRLAKRANFDQWKMEKRYILI